MQTQLRSLLAAFLLAASAAASSAEGVAILPGELVLTGSAARHRVLVQQVLDDGFGKQLTEGVELISSDPKIAEIDGFFVVPRSNGEATITARVGDRTAAAHVTVRGMEREHEWTFRNHVEAILAKAGCNSGACHGALAGKGGMKLSLRGYDVEHDYQIITRQARGRRVELADPARSLILAKPSGAIPHKGGLRFETDSLEYEIFASWIANGAQPPRDDDPRLERLEVLPRRATLAPGDREQVLVRAHYSDGHVEDVTRWAKYASANEAVAKIDDDGVITVVGHGEGAITAWFASRIVLARVTSPYPNDVPDEVFADAPRRNFIDELVLAKLKSLKLPPSPPASDAEFLRRVYVDTIGLLPTADEARAFLADESPGKRDRVIEELLARPEFVDYWTYKWSDVLLLNGTRLRPKALKAYYDWIHGEVEKNTPWDEFVRKIVTATGSSYKQGATNFYALHQTPQEMSENVSQAFMGLSIACAKCHNHPLEKWTNNQYYAMANMFARVRAKGWGGEPRSGNGLRTLYVVDQGELIQPLTGKPQPPTPLDGEPLPFDSTEDRRVALAQWLTSPDNPYFSRSIANRVWANFFGVGLVEAVDDMRASNPASNEELLDAAAQYLVDHDFNLKALMRAILQSNAYQRSSQPLPGNKDEHRFYSRYYPRRMMAEVLLDVISQVTDVPTEFTQVAFPGGDLQKTDFYPLGTRAIQLYDAAVQSYFLETFGRNERLITCECERTEEPSMVQVLHISNGDTINEKLQAKESRVTELLASGKSNEQIIEDAYLAALGRYPTDAERERLLALMNEVDPKKRRLAVEDLYWGILSSREFLFNH
jgi:hypothetical protein